MKILNNSDENKKIYQILFNIFLLLVLPIAVLAPMGVWIPLILMAIIMFCSTKSFKNITFDKKYIILLLTFILVTLLSCFIFNFKIKTINNLISLYFILFSLLSVLSMYEVKNNFKPYTIKLVISLTISSFLIILDSIFQLGLKLWLSNNLDFNNFNNFYTFKKWISFTEFQKNHQLIIENFLGNTYDRGITAISVLALPISALCFFFNLKKTAFLVFFITAFVLCTFFNITALISFLLAFLFFYCLVLIRFFKKKTLLILMLIYFSTSPIFLGNLNYKNFSDYENELEKKYDLLENKILNDYPFFYKNNDNTHLENKTKNFYQMAFNAFYKSDNKASIFLYGLNWYLLKLEGKILHRRVIWSFSKEKILERPLFGYGIFSSRFIGYKYKIINRENKILSAIPLHPHNSILQIWLELGVVGIILFYIFLCMIINKIYQIKKINRQYAAFSLASLFQIFLIGQFSYGFWQTWWISIIFISIFIYTILYKKLLQAR